MTLPKSSRSRLQSTRPITQRLVLRQLRGKSPTVRISAKLGFKSNVVASWEAGRRKINWSQFVDFCDLVDPNFLNDLRRFYNLEVDMADWSAILLSIRGNRSSLEFSNLLMLSESKFSKILTKKQVPTLDEMLRALALEPGVLISFLSANAKFAEALESAPVALSKRIFSEHPSAALVWTALELDRYQSGSMDAHEIASICRLSFAETIEILRAMEKLGIVTHSGGIWKHTEDPICVVDSSRERNASLRFWLKRSHQALLEKPDQTPRCSHFNIFAADEQAEAEIKQLSAEYFAAVGRVLEAARTRPSSQLYCLLSTVSALESEA